MVPAIDLKFSHARFAEKPPPPLPRARAYFFSHYIHFRTALFLQRRTLTLTLKGAGSVSAGSTPLGVGEATVKAHVTVILRKLGVRSRTQAVIEARGLALPTG